MARAAFDFPVLRFIVKGWFFFSAVIFFYLFWMDVFVHRYFILVWALFCLFLAFYTAPAIRVGPSNLGVKYVLRYHLVPWRKVIAVKRGLLGLQIFTLERNPLYRCVNYQFPLPYRGVLAELVVRQIEAHRR